MVKPTDSVTVSKFLKPDSILFFTRTHEKTEIIDALMQCISKHDSELNVKTATKKIMEREQGISTVLDTGLSIPHARIDDLSDFSVALGLIPEGFKDPIQPEITVKAMFLFLSSSNTQFFNKHLQLLAALSALFQPVLIDRLISSSTEQQVMEAIIASE